MKKRIMLSVLVIALAAALIAGATQAWFTDEKDLPVAEFTAGTLEIDVSEGEPFILALENRVFENTNPGDCATIVWNIENIGTKRAEIRVKIDSEWLRQTSADTWAKFEPDIDPELDYKGRAAFFAPKGDEWVMYEDEEGMWLYYTGNALLGSYDIEKGEEGENSVQLCLVVGFDGPNMDNQYQGKKFKISGEVQAVQTTNGAPEAVWGIDSLEAIKEGEAEGIYVEEYFTEGERGYDMPCWEGEEEPPPVDKFKVEADVEPENSGCYVTGTGENFEEGASIQLEAIPGDGYEFVRWEDLPVGAVVEGATVSFIMPDENVKVKAVFEPEEIIITLEDFRLDWNQSKVEDKNNKNVLLKTRIINAVGSDGKPFSGTVEATIWHSDHPNYKKQYSVQITNGASGEISTGTFFINEHSPNTNRSKIKVQIGDLIRSPQSHY